MPTAAQIRPRVAASLARHPGRPLVIAGPTGAGKTTLLRVLASEANREAVWCPAVDLAGWVVEAVRGSRYPALCASLVADPRPLVVEHLEDLRGKPRTRAELRSLLKTASEHRPVLLTLTRARRDRDVRRWLRGGAEVVSLDGYLSRSRKERMSRMMPMTTNTKAAPKRKTRKTRRFT